MSMYLETDNEEQEMVASNLGWSQMLDYAETLDQEQYPLLTEIAQQGECDSPAELAQECESAKEGASQDVAPILETMQAFCEQNGDAEIILVTNGMTVE